MKEYHFRRISGHSGRFPKGSFQVTAETVKDAVREAEALTSYQAKNDGGIINFAYVVAFRAEGVEDDAVYTVTPTE